MADKSSTSWKWFCIAGFMLVAVVYSGYFLERHDPFLLVIFTLLFASYFWLIKFRKEVNLTTHFTAGLLLRLSLLLAVPNLSDDLFRFIWDGQLTWNGIHPFARVPSYYVTEGELPAGLTLELYNQLNSPDYYTVYPPVSQFFFMITAAITGGSITISALVLRLLLIAGECGTFFLLKKLSLQIGLDPKRVSWYWLNPLVILEISGNLHLEGLMIFFCLLSVLLITYRSSLMAGGVFGLAIGVKLIPLLFLPVLWKHIGTKEILRFGLATAGVIGIFSIPFIDTALISGMGDSLSLYFNKFEFNASFYYIVREAGWWYKGYNIIQTAGPYMAFLTFAIIIYFAFLHSPEKVSLTSAMGISMTIYLLLATTVHPWYILILIALMPLQRVYYPVIWSALITVSYAGYTINGYQENLWLTFMEYAVVIVYMGYEIFYGNKFSRNPLFRDPFN